MDGDVQEATLSKLAELRKNTLKAHITWKHDRALAPALIIWKHGRAHVLVDVRNLGRGREWTETTTIGHLVENDRGYHDGHSGTILAQRGPTP